MGAWENSMMPNVVEDLLSRLVVEIEPMILVDFPTVDAPEESEGISVNLICMNSRMS